MASYEVQAKKLFFPEGMPGFSDLYHFHLEQSEPESPFFFLQSLEDEHVGFWVLDPFPFFPQYEFTLPDSVKNQLQIRDGTPIFVCNVITLRPDGQITVNLRAPIVVNEANQTAKQVILIAEHYEVRQPLMQIRAKAASE